MPPEYFSSIPTSASTSYNYNLTIIGCYALCGQPKSEPCNGDAGVRLLTWLLPILLMVVNMPFPNVGWERFATIFIPLGNPLGFLWGMLVEIETWAVLKKLAEKIVGKDNTMDSFGRAIVARGVVSDSVCILREQDKVERLWRERLGLLRDTDTHPPSNGDKEDRKIDTGTNKTAYVSELAIDIDTISKSVPQPRPPLKQLKQLDNDLANLWVGEFRRASLASIMYILLTLGSFTPKLSGRATRIWGQNRPSHTPGFSSQCCRL